LKFALSKFGLMAIIFWLGLEEGVKCRAVSLYPGS